MLITYIVQVTICLAFFYALYHVALQKETLFQTNRIYLLVSVVMSLILPLIRIYILEQQNAQSFVTAPYVYVGSYLSTMNQVIITPSEHAIPWLSILTSLYISGVLFMSYKIIVSVVAILKMKRSGEKKWLYDQRCVLSPDVRSPFSFFNTVYLPLDHQFSEDEMKEIIAHEKTHVLGLHTFDVLFMELVCIGLWPSPMVYLYRKKLREVHEFLADAEVVKNTPWESYASFLVAQKNEGLQHRLSNQLIYSQLKNRLIMMNKERSFQSAKYKYFGIVPILLMALVIFSFREKATPHKNSNNSGYQVYNIYKDGLQVYTPFDSIWSADSRIPNHDTCILLITEDKRYFLNQKEIKYEFLKEALTIAAKKSPGRYIYLQIDKHLTVADLVNVMKLGDKLNIRFILPEENKDKAIYNSRDSLSTTVVIAYDESSKSTEDKQSDTTEGKMETEKSDKEKVFQLVDEMPHFPGSTDEMYKYIYEAIKYPEEERVKGNEGMVIARFVVEPDGSISNVEIIRGQSPGLNAEIIRVINGMNSLPEKWTPGKINGKAVPVEFTMPFKFQLQQKQIKQEDDILENGVYTYIEEMPRFPGCEGLSKTDRFACSNAAIVKYLASEMKYPEEDKRNRIEGMVLVQFVVGIDGTVSQPVIRHSVSPTIDAEVIRIINRMNDMPQKWVPGHKDGNAVPVMFTLPVKFQLSSEQAKTIPTSSVNTEDQNSSDKMNWTRTDTSLVFNPETKEEEILVTSISPSVVSNNLQVEFSKNVKSAFIFNDAGSVMWQKDFKKDDDTTQWIDVSKWTSGIYRVKSTSGAQNAFSSFVVQH